MATTPVDSFLLEFGARDAGFRQEFRQNAALVEEFGQRVDRVAAGLTPLDVKVDAAGTEAGLRTLEGLLERVGLSAQEAAAIAEAGLRSGFEAGASEAIEELRGLGVEVESLRAKLGEPLTLPPLAGSGVGKQTAEEISGEIKSAFLRIEDPFEVLVAEGTKASQRLGTELSKGISGAGLDAGSRKAVDTTFRELDRQMQARLSDLRSEFSLGLIDEATFSAEGAKAIENFHASARATIERLPKISARSFVDEDRSATVSTNAIAQAAERAQRQASAAFTRIAADVRLANADLKAGKIAVDDWRIALASAKTEYVSLRSQGFEPAGRELTKITNLLGTKSTRTREATRNLGTLRSGMVALAAQSLGTSSSLGVVASQLLLFGTGSAIVIGAAAGLAAIGFAYDRLTEHTRKSREEKEKDFEALKKLREQQTDPLVLAQGLADTGAEEVKRLTTALEAERQALSQARRDVEAGDVAAVDRLGRTLDRVVTLSRQLAEAESLRSAGITNTAKVATDFENERVQNLSKALSLGEAGRVAQEELNSLLREARADLEAVNARLEDRNISEEQRRKALKEQADLLDRIGTITGAQEAASRKALEADRNRVQALREQTTEAVAVLGSLREADASLDRPANVKIQIADALDALKILRADLDATIAKAKALGESTADFEKVRGAIDKALAPADPSRIENVVKAVGELTGRLAALTGASASATEAERNQVTVAAALVEKYVALRKAIEEQGGAISANADLVKAADAAFGALAETGTGGIEAVLAALGAASTELSTLGQDLARATSSEQQIRLLLDIPEEEATAKLAGVLALLRRMASEKIIASITLDDDEIDKVVSDAEKEFAKLQRGLERLADPGEALADLLGNIAQAADVFADIGDDLGFLDEQAQQVVGTLGDVAGAISALAANGGLTFGNILGAAGAVGGLIASLSAPGERDRLLEENTRAIERNTVARGDPLGLGGGSDFAAAIRAIQTDPEVRGDFAAARSESERSRILIAAFAELGFTLDDIRQAADEFGIDVFDEKGRLVGSALEDLRTEILATVAAQLRFRQTLDDQILERELRARLEGEDLDAPGARANITLDALREISPEFAQRFDAADDLSTDEEREAFRKTLLQVLDDLDSGALAEGAAELGGLTRDDIVRLLEEGADALDAFKEGLDEATGSLLNVPQGFKLAAAEFAVQDAEPWPRRDRLEDLPGPNVDPAQFPGGQGPAIPSFDTMSPVARAVTAVREVNIYVDGRGKDVDAIARAVKDRFERDSMATTGTPDQWGQFPWPF